MDKLFSSHHVRRGPRHSQREALHRGHGYADRANGEASDPLDLRACGGIVRGRSPGSQNDKFTSKVMEGLNLTGTGVVMSDGLSMFS